MANGIIEQIQLPNGDIYDIGGSDVTGVKGNNESVYRTGDVNLTAANIGAISVNGDTISGTIDMVKAAGTSDLGYYVNNTSKGHKIGLIIGGSNGNAGLADVTKQKWIVYSDINGNVILNGNANSATSVPLSGVTDADDLKAIEALTGTSGVLIKTAANTWALDPTPYVSNISWENTNGTISRTINGVAADVVKEVPGYNTETITTLVDNLTISNFYLDDTYNTELYRSENNALTGLTTANFDSNGSYKVIWDGTEYDCEYQIMPSSSLMNSAITQTSWWDCRMIGNSTLLEFAPIDSTNLPFLITYRYDKDTNFILWTNATTSSHTITIKKVVRNYKPMAFREIPSWFKYSNENLPIVRKGNGENIIIGNSPNARGQGAISIGSNTLASSSQAISIGAYSTASGYGAIAIGYHNSATIDVSFVGGGYENSASAAYGSILGGRKNSVTGNYSTIVGGYSNSTTATCSTVVGGQLNQANGGASLASGQNTIASGNFSSTFGKNTIATGCNQMAIGAYNIEDTDDGTNYTQYGTGAKKYLFLIGNGTATDARSNALTVDWNGNVNISGSYTGLGTNLTSLNASNISNGTLAADRLATSGVTAGSYGPSANATPAYGVTFNVPYITVDAYGRVTAASTKTVKIPVSDNTDTKQNVTLATTSKAYITGVTTAPTSTAQALAGVADTGVYLTTTAGEISAVRHSFNVSGTEKAYMVFNSTTNAIDFIFN